jgi:hypothetical protein
MKRCRTRRPAQTVAAVGVTVGAHVAANSSARAAGIVANTTDLILKLRNKDGLISLEKYYKYKIIFSL